MEAGKSKIKVLADSGLDEGPLPSLETAPFLLCPHMVERLRLRERLRERVRERCFGVSSYSYKDTNSIKRPLPS